MIKPKKPIRFRVTDPIYKSELNVILSTQEYYSNYLRKKHKFERTYNPHLLGSLTEIPENGELWYYLWLPITFNFYIKEWGTLAHEILHFTFLTMDLHGITYSGEDSEACNYFFNYVLEAVVTKLNNALNKAGIKPTKRAK